jgi:flagellar FliJ protein
VKRFRFQLETLLSLRKRKEEQARLELGRITGECNRLDENLKILAKERQVSLSRDREQFAGELMKWYAYRERYLKRIDSRIVDVQKQRAGLEIKREDAAKVYRQAHADLSVLEKLRERRFNLHRKELLKDEQSTIDDIAGSRYHIDLGYSREEIGG